MLSRVPWALAQISCFIIVVVFVVISMKLLFIENLFPVRMLWILVKLFYVTDGPCTLIRIFDWSIHCCFLSQLTGRMAYGSYSLTCSCFAQLDCKARGFRIVVTRWMVSMWTDVHNFIGIGRVRQNRDTLSVIRKCSHLFCAKESGDWSCHAFANAYAESAHTKRDVFLAAHWLLRMIKLCFSYLRSLYTFVSASSVAFCFCWGSFLGRWVCIPGYSEIYEGLQWNFLEGLGMTQEGSDYILVVMQIILWILDHPRFFTIRI